MIQGEVKKRKQLWEILWGPATGANIPKVDNEHVAKLLKGGYIFGFSASDLLIILSAILTLIFLQLQPYLIPYLEGNLDVGSLTIKESKVVDFDSAETESQIIFKVEKSASPSSTMLISTSSADLKNTFQESTSSSKSPIVLPKKQ